MSAFNGNRRVPLPANEPVKTYAPGTVERTELKARLASMAAERIEIPIVIGGKEFRSGKIAQAVMPHDHAHVLADWHMATPEMIQQAVAAAAAARKEWSSWSWGDRAAVFLKAAELLTTARRQTLNAATMLGQSKTAFQAEIDSACELIDFWRFNPYYAEQLYDQQPISDHTMWNQLDYRGLEGFVYAVTPFNFTSIAGNLPTSPALMGNAVIWKPAATAIVSAWYIFKLLEEAGLPPGVINFVPGDPVVISDALNHASIIDGIRLCKAERRRYANGDMAELEKHLAESQDKRTRLIATDGVFSMDGFIAKLDEIVAPGLAEIGRQRLQWGAAVDLTQNLAPHLDQRAHALWRQIQSAK